MRSACARMVQSCFYHTASPLNNLRTAQWTMLPSLRHLHLHHPFPASKPHTSRSKHAWTTAAVPASSAPSEQNTSFYSTSAAPLPAFLSSYSDQVAASLLTLDKNDVHIWWLRHHYQNQQHHGLPSGGTVDLGPTCAALLSTEEAAECATSTDPASQELRLVARAFTRSVLSRYLGDQTTPSSLVFERNEHGKPEILHNKASLRFNLTHTPGLVGVAVTNGAAVGLDAESLSRKTKGNALKLAQRRFAELEIKQLESLQNDPEAQAALFIKLWTLKEAYVKAIGKGIGAPPGLRGFSFLLNEASSELVFESSQNELSHFSEIDTTNSSSDETTWQFALMQPVEGHLAAVCSERNLENGKDNVGSELRITSFLADTDGTIGAEVMVPRIIATGSST
jgi:4'-phosphopantetheinyl transferase